MGAAAATPLRPALKTMRIWHQSFTVLSELGAYDQALRVHFERVSRPDTKIVMHGMREGTYRTNYPGDDIRHAGFQLLHALQFVEAAVQAERQGFDAFALSTLPEPALVEIRTLVDIPVVGYGESAAKEAAGHGRFGALVFIPELADLYAANVRRYEPRRSSCGGSRRRLPLHRRACRFDRPAHFSSASAPPPAR